MNQVASLTAESAARAKPSQKISYKEFLERYDGVFAEWVEGEIEMGMSVSRQHADDSGFLETLLRFFADARDLGKVYSAPFQMRLADQERGREPDVLFISKSNEHRLTPQYLDGPADIAIEILSPESIGRDRGDKFVEYEAAGVREYWLIDPERKQAEFYALDDDNRYKLMFGGREGKFESSVLNGFFLQVEWLWQQPMPKVPVALKELGVL